MSRSNAAAALLFRRKGDGSTLNLDFTKISALDSRFTFTRSTTGTYINSSGYVASAAINEARFDYDPTTLAAKGLLIEGPATNLLNFSETFATTGGTNNNWADTNLTRTSTNNTSPRNDATALRITASAANGTIISSAALGTSAARTLSVWLRRVTGTGNIQFTLDNGSTYTTQAITAVWVRYTFATTTAAQRVGFRIVTSADAIEIWGVQLEDGTGASSYIPTTTAQVTRALDSCVMSSTNFSNWFNSSTGTFITNVTYTNLSGDNGGLELSVGTSSSPANRFGIRKAYIDVYSGSVNSAEMYPTVTSGNVRIGFAYAVNDFAMCSNGGTMRTDSSGAVPISLDTFKFYSDAGSSTGYFINGYISSFKYFPTRLTNAQLQALTT